MIIFFTEEQFTRTCEELNINSTIDLPKWVGSTNIRNIFTKILHQVKFDGRIINKDAQILSIENSNLFGLKLDNSDIDELIHNSVQKHTTFWRIFTSFYLVKESDNTYTDIQGNIFLSFLNKTHNEIYGKQINETFIKLIEDYIVLRFKYSSYNSKIITKTLVKILVGNNKRFTFLPVYGKWKVFDECKLIEYMHSIDLWIECNKLLSYDTLKRIKSDSHRDDVSILDITIEFINSLDFTNLEYVEIVNTTKLYNILHENLDLVRVQIQNLLNTDGYIQNNNNHIILNELKNNILCISKIRKMQNTDGTHTIKAHIPLILFPIDRSSQKNLQFEIILVIHNNYVVQNISVNLFETDNNVTIINHRIT